MRPLSRRSPEDSDWPQRRAWPNNLSRALWRPTSSKSSGAAARSSRENQAQACSPPVAAKAGWAARSRSGKPARVAAATSGAGPGTSTWSGRSPVARSVLLQMPQLDEVKTCRVSRAGSNLAGSLRRTSTLSPVSREAGWSARASSATAPGGGPWEAHSEISKRSSGPRITPSVRRNPAANSRSCPGVRITTATARPSTRKVRGDSAATQSAASSQRKAPLASRLARRRCRATAARLGPSAGSGFMGMTFSRSSRRAAAHQGRWSMGRSGWGATGPMYSVRGR